MVPSSEQEASNGYLGWKGYPPYRLGVIPVFFENISLNFSILVPQYFVRFVAQFKVKLAQLAVVPAHDQVVSQGVNVQRGNPFDPRLQSLQQSLGHKVIHPYIPLGLIRKCLNHCAEYQQDTHSEKQDRPCWVKYDLLNFPLDFSERALGMAF